MADALDTLSHHMIDLLVAIDGCPPDESYVGSDFYTTADALERRGLMTVSKRWRELRPVALTPRGRTLASNMD